jgi:aspartate-semialdehyde dehydrogenase
MPSHESDGRLSVGILGATGIVGQRLVALLEGHPWFKVSVVGASATSVGKRYGDIKWRIDIPPVMPTSVVNLELVPCEVEYFKQCSWVFSALDSKIAAELEPKFRDASLPVFTNSSAYRMDSSVPLIVPTANGQALFDKIREGTATGSGLLIANSNCTTSGIAVVLRAFINAGLELDKVMIHSLQAVSGAGASPGISVMDIHDNVIPFIDEEEPKIEEELKKILQLPNLKVSASCNRVAVTDGHTVNVAIGFRSGLDKSTIVARAKEALYNYKPIKSMMKLPSMPAQPLFLFDDSMDDRPQPKLDRMREGGMCTSVGRVRECPVLDVKLTLLLHNTILGAAGSALLNAEIVYAEDKLPRK